MPQSLSFILIHIIFSVKDRAPLLGPEVRPRMHAYMATLARDAGCECYQVGGVADHAHLAVRLPRTLTTAKLVEQLKSHSSKWIKEQWPELDGFAWQRGYGAFSVGPKDLPALQRYIEIRKSITGSEASRMSTGRFWSNTKWNLTKNTFGIEPGLQPFSIVNTNSSWGCTPGWR